MTSEQQQQHKVPFSTFCVANVAAPYLTGPIMVVNEKRLEKWGWLPKENDNEDDDKIRMIHDKANPNEIHFIS